MYTLYSIEIKKYFVFLLFFTLKRKQEKEKVRSQAQILAEKGKSENFQQKKGSYRREEK